MFASIPARSADLATDTIALPAGTVEGVLDNGLRYLILPNDFPAGRAEFRLVWKVGAVQQDDDQGGCAHFLEHIAFGGSENFPNRGAVAYLESLGMKYGIDINAYTGHDRTIYMFATPSDSLREGGFAKPLSIIRDWMDRLTINPARVETEKGIILEELRSTFQEDPFYDLKIGQNRFSRRMPLGNADEISRMTSDVLAAYYRKWYIPSLGAVVVAGDVDPASVEREIKRQFSSLQKAPDPGYRAYALTYDPPRQIMVEADSLNTREEIEIMLPHSSLVTRTLADARRQQLGGIVVSALARRIADEGLKGDVSDAWYLGSTNHLVFTARGSGDMAVDSCVARIANTVASAADLGFTPEEIEYHARKAAKRLERFAGNGGKSSDMWCDDFADYIITGDRYLSDPRQVKRLSEAVAAISASEATELLKQWLNEAADTMLIAVRTIPEEASGRTLAAITARWAEGLAAPRHPYAFTPDEETVLEEIPTPTVLAERFPYDEKMVSARRDYASLGIRSYELANGITLLIKQTADDGPALFGSLAPGGYSSLTPERLPLLNGTASYIDMGGIAKGPENLGDYLYRNDMSLSTTIENDWHGFLGAFDTAKSAEFFNLAFEKITDPQLCYSDFEEIRESMLEDVGKESILEKMLNRAPDRMLTARMDELMGNGAPAPARDNSEEGLELQRRAIRAMSLDSMATFYRRLFSRPEGSVFIICGNFNPDSVARQFIPVFSRLEASAKPLPRQNSALALPTEPLSQRFPNENPSQTAFDYLFFGRYEPGLRESLVLKLMSNVLRNHVIAELREKRALVYSPFVALNYEGKPRGYFYFDINSSADNARMPEVHEALFDVINHLRSEAVDAAELDALKRSCVIAKRETLNPYSPSAWRSTLLSLLKNGENLADFDRYEAVIDSITPEEVRRGFESFLNPELYVLLYMSDTEARLD